MYISEPKPASPTDLPKGPVHPAQNFYYFFENDPKVADFVADIFRSLVLLRRPPRLPHEHRLLRQQPRLVRRLRFSSWPQAQGQTLMELGSGINGEGMRARVLANAQNYVEFAKWRWGMGYGDAAFVIRKCDGKDGNFRRLVDEMGGVTYWGVY
ncbi:MAG: hypothetical protein Q9166_004958 [cf. Caloplaca sp. 2 TL-2023]